MQIILSSAKIMKTRTTATAPLSSQAAFRQEAGLFAQEMGLWEEEDIARELHCNLEIARENKRRFARFPYDGEGLPALLAYHGQAYKYLKADTFSAGDFRFAQQHLFIPSFLYGLLRPLDLILPYRMEGNVKLEATDNQTFFAYWRPRLTQMLIDAVQADDGILVHLTTGEFEHVFDWKRVKREVRVVQPLFYVDDGRRLKTIVVHAKSCRGAMTRHIILNRLSRPEDMNDFELNGFKHNARFGDADHPHFILDM